jgi:hypothetical protein
VRWCVLNKLFGDLGLLAAAVARGCLGRPLGPAARPRQRHVVVSARQPRGSELRAPSTLQCLYNNADGSRDDNVTDNDEKFNQRSETK